MRRSKTGKDIVLAGGKFTLPAGVALHMPITAVHHNKDVWEDPRAFNPERFLEVSAFTLPLYTRVCLRSATSRLAGALIQGPNIR